MTSWSDFRLAIRSLRRSPLFATVAILSLALGIGANTAIFTLIDQIVLRKLSVKSPDQLVMLYQRGSHNGSNMGGRMHSYPIYQDYQQKAEPLAEVHARPGELRRGGQEPVHVRGAQSRVGERVQRGVAHDIDCGRTLGRDAEAVLGQPDDGDRAPHRAS